METVRFRSDSLRICLLVAALAYASGAHAWSSPQEVVDHFLRFELSGGRLQAWPIRKYLAVPADYDEPGWDTVHIVRHYRVGSPHCAQEKCEIPVTFTFVPTAELGDAQIAAHPDGGKETITYTAIRVGKSWLLESSNGAPKVTLSVMKRHLAM